MSIGPRFSAFDVFKAMTQPGVFRDLTRDDFMAFADAPKESLIGEIGDWLVIVCVVDGGKIHMEAHSQSGDDLGGGFLYEPNHNGGEWAAA